MDESILDGIGKDIYNPGNFQPGLAFSDAMALGEAWLTSEEPAVVTSTISAYNPSLLEQIGNIFNSWRADRKMRSEWMNSDKGKAFQAELNKLKLFESQDGKSYFEESSIESFHSNYQCSTRGLQHVESFKVIRGYN